jgi:hypothetical protein
VRLDVRQDNLRRYKTKQPTKRKNDMNITPITEQNTKEEILAAIDAISKDMRNPRFVTEEEMNRLYSVFGSEEAIKNYKKKRNEVLNTEINRLEELLIPR